MGLRNGGGSGSKGGGSGPPKQPAQPPKQPDPAPPKAADCKANSFTPHTGVVMADGSAKAIEDVEVGDEVLATDPKTGKAEARPVLALITGVGVKDLVEVTVDTDGDKGDDTGTVVATDGHPFWVENHGAWVDAKDLRPGDMLRTSAGTWVQVQAVHEFQRHQRVHNLTVAGIHTYHVTTTNTDLLVHNCSGRVDGPLPDKGQTALYALANDKTGEILKWGISKNPTRRYTCDCLEELGARMQILKNFDTRKEALAAERYLTERFPGPLNYENWAGSVTPSGTWQDALNFVRGGGLWRS